MTQIIPTVIIPIVYNEKLDWYWEKSKDAIGSVMAQTVQPELVVSVGLTHAEAKNSGVDKANTEWCMFLDADDTLEPEFIENLEMTDNNVGLLKPQCYINGVHMTFPVANLLSQNFLINGCVFKKEIYQEVGGSEDRAFPDWFLWAKMLTRRDIDIQEVESRYNYLRTNVGLNSQNTTQDYLDTKNDIKDYFEEYAVENDTDELIPNVRKVDRDE